jgi:hypothetical protein
MPDLYRAALGMNGWISDRVVNASAAGGAAATPRSTSDGVGVAFNFISSTGVTDVRLASPGAPSRPVFPLDPSQEPASPFEIRASTSPGSSSGLHVGELLILDDEGLGADGTRLVMHGGARPGERPEFGPWSVQQFASGGAKSQVTLLSPELSDATGYDRYVGRVIGSGLQLDARETSAGW